MSGPTAPKLLPSPSFQSSSTPLRTAIGALNTTYYDSPPDVSSYVLTIAPVGGVGAQYAVSTSAPSNAVHVVDRETLRFVCSLNGGGGGGGYVSSVGKAGKANVSPNVQAHEGGVTCLKAIKGSEDGGGGGLISCGREGSVVIWDTRTAGVGVKMNVAAGLGGKTRSLLSCDISSDGRTVAAGTELQGDDAIIAYWDPRNPTTALRTHTSTHSDDITVVSFAPSGFATNVSSTPDSDDDDDALMASSSQHSDTTLSSDNNESLLLTGSTDGLLSLSDANEGDEDEAVILTANWGTSIAQAGWIGERGVWAGSDMETFSTWTADLDPVLNFDIREPGSHTDKAEWVTDYLVTCHSSPLSTHLRVFVGSNEGDVALISTPSPFKKPSPKRPPTTTTTSAPWYLHNKWTHQHVGVVRALLYDEKHGVIVTGGEDAKVHIWRDPIGHGQLYGGADGDDVDMDGVVEEEISTREVNRRKRELGSDAEDDAMDGKRRRRKVL